MLFQVVNVLFLFGFFRLNVSGRVFCNLALNRDEKTPVLPQ